MNGQIGGIGKRTGYLKGSGIGRTPNPPIEGNVRLQMKGVVSI